MMQLYLLLLPFVKCKEKKYIVLGRAFNCAFGVLAITFSFVENLSFNLVGTKH